MNAPLSNSRSWPGLAVCVALLTSIALLVQPAVPSVTGTVSQDQPAAPADGALAELTIDLPGSTLWQNTGLDLQTGDSVRVIANGELVYAGTRQPSGPDGLTRGLKDLIRFLPISEAGRGALIARIGMGEASRPFFVGTSSQFPAPATGRLYLGINQAPGNRGDGTYHVTIRILSRAPASSANPPSAAHADAPFSAVFCTVLEREHPDAGQWGECSDYIQDAVEESVALQAIPRIYHVAIVSGVLSVCGGDSTAFREGREHMRAVHGITVDLIPSPDGSSAANGKTIAQFIKASYRKDGRKFILIGYSKGAPDILEGMADDPEAARDVAALITVAGAIGGSPIADLMPVQAQQWIQAISLGQCKGDLYSAFRSLRRDVRRKFLAQHPDPGFPVYSISAFSSKDETSKVLVEGWMFLSIFGQPEDSQLLESDTRYPGGHILGAVHADHIAVAIPYENMSDPELRKLVNHNHFPRTTLLESLLRYVISDLNASRTASASAAR